MTPKLCSVVLLLLLLTAFTLTGAGCSCSGSGSSASENSSTSDYESVSSNSSGEETDSNGNDSSEDTEDSTDSGGSTSADNSDDSGDATEAGDTSDEDTSSPGYRDIVAEYLTIFLDYDGYGAQFDLALSAVESYLAGTLSREDTESEVEAVRAALTEGYNLALADYTVSDELSTALQEYGILPEEFEYFADLRAGQALEYLTDLDYLDDYLPYADDYEFEWEQVSFWYELHSTLQDAYRGYYYYGSVNYWFAEWEAEPTAYVQDTVLPLLESYLPETYVWETTRTATEEKAMSYLDIVEECVELQAEHLAESTEALNALKRALADSQ